MFNGDIRYARSRIEGTWVKLKEDDNKFKLFECARLDGRSLETSRIINLKGEEEPFSKFCYQMGPLGFINSQRNGYATLLTKMSKRRDWKQGLRETQLVMTSRIDKNVGVPDNFIRKELTAINRLLNNEYPSTEDAVELLEEIGQSISISRRFKLEEDYRLFYRVYPVGKLNADLKYELEPKFNFLMQELDEAVGPENVSR